MSLSFATSYNCSVFYTLRLHSSFRTDYMELCSKSRNPGKKLPVHTVTRLSDCRRCRTGTGTCWRSTRWRNDHSTRLAEYDIMDKIQNVEVRCVDVVLVPRLCHYRPQQRLVYLKQKNEKRNVFSVNRHHHHHNEISIPPATMKTDRRRITSINKVIK